MNSNDLQLWESGIRKLDAGAVGTLTAAECATLLFFGGPKILERGKRPVPPAKHAKHAYQIQTADVKNLEFK